MQIFKFLRQAWKMLMLSDEHHTVMSSTVSGPWKKKLVLQRSQFLWEVCGTVLCQKWSEVFWMDNRQSGVQKDTLGNFQWKNCSTELWLCTGFLRQLVASEACKMNVAAHARTQLSAAGSFQDKNSVIEYVKWMLQVPLTQVWHTTKCLHLEACWLKDSFCKLRHLLFKCRSLDLEILCWNVVFRIWKTCRLINGKIGNRWINSWMDRRIFIWDCLADWGISLFASRLMN